MKIADFSVVELIYDLMVDGELVDHTTKDNPLDFIFGTGSLLGKFEEQIKGLEAGSKFEFTLAPEDAYGVYDETKTTDLPIAAFEGHEQFLKLGCIVPLFDETGRVVHAKVAEIGELFVKMDLNHPMAGKALNFTGEVLTVREASQKEITEGLHGELVKHGCGGCHGGNCGGGCHGDGGCGEGGCGEGGCNCGEGGCGCSE